VLEDKEINTVIEVMGGITEAKEVVRAQHIYIHTYISDMYVWEARQATRFHWAHTGNTRDRAEL
jgi:hypothetical protein